MEFKRRLHGIGRHSPMFSHDQLDEALAGYDFAEPIDPSAISVMTRADWDIVVRGDELVLCAHVQNGDGRFGPVFVRARLVPGDDRTAARDFEEPQP